MVIRRDTVFRRSLALADTIAIAIAMVVSVLLIGDDSLHLASLAIPPLFVLVAKALGLYDRDEHLLHKTTLDEVPKLVGIASLSALLLYLSDGFVVDGGLERLETASAWGLLIVLLVALRSAARSLARMGTPAERCLYVGDTASAEELRDKLATSRTVKAEFVGWIPAVAPGMDGSRQARLPERIRLLVKERDVHRVILGPGPGRSDELLDSIRRIKDHGVKVSVLPDFNRVVSTGVEIDRLNGISLLGVRRFEITTSSRVIKRSFDIVGSATALLVFAPVLSVVAIAIKLDTRGPILYAQRRAGRHGEPFCMLKFRSMVVGADQMKPELTELNEAAEGLFKIADDPRITRVGRWLRRAHIDELPQLYNVLRGEMSLVGPRPLVLQEDRRIEGWHRRRLYLRPGITGPWQVLGASRIPVREMVRLDYQYVADWSLWNDIRILLLTITTVLHRRGM